MGSLSRVSRISILIALPLAALAALLLAGPLRQPASFYDYADTRNIYGIVNFSDVVSSLAFLGAGLLGLVHCLKHRPAGALWAWCAFFVGVALVSAGSAHYHLAPAPATLIWDRLPITIGFMAAVVALVAEYVDPRLEKPLLVPALLVGAGGVVYWVMADDLALYFAVQGGVFLAGFWILLAFDSPYRQKGFIAAAFLSYALALVFELLDHRIFAFTNEAISGHTLKHLVAALVPYWIYRMLAERARAAGGRANQSLPD